MKAHPSQRILAFFLALAFALPPAPAHALRQEPPAEAHPATLSGLEENLSAPAAGLEELPADENLRRLSSMLFSHARQLRDSLDEPAASQL